MKNFKMRTIVVLFVMLALVLVGCGPKTPAETPFDAAAAIAAFDKKVETTVKLTYTTNYQVDVVRPGADASGMDSFKRDVVATAVVEMDLGTDLYIKVTKTRQDRLVDATATTTEEILYKKDGVYYYQTSSAEAVVVEDAAAKLATIFEEATYEQIGGLTLDALLYNSLDKNYELKLIGLSETFMADELATPVYAAGENGGLKVTYKPEYVGYRTDGGWSDFSNAADGYAAEVEILTNNKGQVTSMKETYNEAGLVFNIMSNPPTVTITGERNFTATYGEAITKAESVELAPSVAVYEEAANGTFVVMTCPNGQFSNMSPVANGGALTMGNIICVKPTANDGYEVSKVVVNGNETPMTDPAYAGGFYCFNVAPGNNTIEVSFKTLTPTNGVVTVTNNTTNTYELQSFDFVNGAPTNYQVITNGDIVPGAPVYGAIVIDSTKEVTVTVNGVETTVNIPAGPITYYCFAVKEGGAYNVVISEKGSAPVVGTNGVVTVTNNTSYDYTLQSFDFVNGTPTNYQVITNGEIVPGAPVFGAIVISADTPVSVVVNGTATNVNIPANGVIFYCFSVKAAGEFNVVINPAA
ncbi:MAG: hypothetical protein J6Q70_00165 [Clostridia bacterium]|nr:hypothetical protein [Clostridia bacterium]